VLDYSKELCTGHPDVYRSEFILWNNKEIIIENKSIFWAHLFEKEICFLQDLSDETENSYHLMTYKLNITIT